jgi:hypothetical protein
MYLASATRPDISYVVSKLSRFVSKPGDDHWRALERVLRYLKGTMIYGIHYTGNPKVLEGYCDANWISDADELYATSGYVFLFGGGALSWKSCKQTVGAKAKTPPFARGLRSPRCTNGDKTTGRLTLCLMRHRTKTCDEVVSSCDPVQHGGPRVIRSIVTGPAWPSRITGLICKGLPVITVCNPALWEYSGDNLGV